MHQVGDTVKVFTQSADREGTVVATIGDEAAIVFRMPNTTSFRHPGGVHMIIVSIHDPHPDPYRSRCDPYRCYRNISPQRVPFRWLKTAVQQGATQCDA